MHDPHDGVSPREMALARATLEVSNAGGTEYDLIARLVQDHGREGALRLFARVELDRLDYVRISTSAGAVLAEQPTWQQRRCLAVRFARVASTQKSRGSVTPLVSEGLDVASRDLPG